MVESSNVFVYFFFKLNGFLRIIYLYKYLKISFKMIKKIFELVVEEKCNT